MGSLARRVVASAADAGEAVDASSAEAVARSFEREDVGVVNDAVDHRGGDGLVSEDASPAHLPQFVTLTSRSLPATSEHATRVSLVRNQLGEVFGVSEDQR